MSKVKIFSVLLIVVFALGAFTTGAQAKKPGDTLSLEIYRDGVKKTVKIELGRQPATPEG